MKEHMNELYEYVMSHIWMSYIRTRCSAYQEWRSGYEWVMSHVWMRYEWVIVTLMNEFKKESYEYVMSHIWMSHTRTRCSAYQEWRSRYEWVMSHVWMRYEWAIITLMKEFHSNTLQCTPRVTQQVCVETCHALHEYKNDSCEWVTSHICMNVRMSHINESCHTYT